jgi:purine-nucleoside phosphorylase
MSDKNRKLLDDESRHAAETIALASGWREHHIALVTEAASVIAHATGVAHHDMALTLGSGWGKAADLIGETVAEIPADKVPGFSASGIPGHTGTIRSVRLPNGKHALMMGARTHFYENKGVRAVAHGVRVAAACGAKILVLTNGAGGIKEAWPPGTPVLIADHINLTGASPLEGATFIDLTDLYSKRLRDIARSVDPSLDEGVYVQFRGPNYETPAEVQMAKAMGGHIVGMSTALEAIAAREAGIEILGLSLITNLAAGISPHPLSHQEVIDAGKAAESVISKLLADIVHAL